MTKLEWHTEKRRIKDLVAYDLNPRILTDFQAEQLTKSIKRFNLVEIPAIDLDGNLLAGNQRIKIMILLGRGEEEIDVRVPNRKLTNNEFREYNIRSNKNTGEWSFDLLSKLNESFLSEIGFSSEELDQIFEIDVTPEIFDLEKELKKLDINKITLQKGDIVQLGNSKLMVGDSTIEADVVKLMAGEKVNMCFTDEPYFLNYLMGKKKHGKAVTGFGAKRDRRYLETESLPDNFMDLWMANVAKVQKEDFSIISFENWKNLPKMWEAMSKHWKIRNLIIWRVPNRVQGFAAKYKLFNKYDIALLGTSPSDKSDLNLKEEPELLQNEFESALFATSGKPYWEGYKKHKKNCPTDFIEHVASDEKNSQQGIIFGTKPIEILIPYIKILTKRNDLVLEPFLGSGSTLIACTKLGRRCFGMEKSNVYAEVVKKRWENLTGMKGIKING